MFKLTVYVPETHLDSVKQALFDAGAGRYARYDRCAWQVRGEGSFRPLPGSAPFLGQTDKVETVAEFRVEMLCASECVSAVCRALRASHPYEEPAFDFTRIHTGEDL